jgi:hypothetical protein
VTCAVRVTCVVWVTCVAAGCVDATGGVGVAVDVPGATGGAVPADVSVWPRIGVRAGVGSVGGASTVVDAASVRSIDRDTVGNSADAVRLGSESPPDPPQPPSTSNTPITAGAQSARRRLRGGCLMSRSMAAMTPARSVVDG